jgi:hypothetical protein
MIHVPDDDEDVLYGP